MLNELPGYRGYAFAIAQKPGGFLNLVYSEDYFNHKNTLFSKHDFTAIAGWVCDPLESEGCNTIQALSKAR